MLCKGFDLFDLHKVSVDQKIQKRFKSQSIFAHRRFWNPATLFLLCPSSKIVLSVFIKLLRKNMICTKACSPGLSSDRLGEDCCVGRAVSAAALTQPPWPCQPWDCVSWGTGPGACFLLAENLQKHPQTPSGEPTGLWQHRWQSHPIFDLCSSGPPYQQWHKWFVFRLCTSCRTQSSPHLKFSKKLIFQCVFFNSLLSSDKNLSLSTLFLLDIRNKNGTGRDFILCYFFLAHVVWEVCTELKHSCYS